MKAKVLLFIASTLFLATANSSQTSKYTFNKSLLQQVSQTLLTYESFLTQNNIDLAVTANFGPSHSKTYNSKDLKCLTKKSCMTSMAIPINAKLSSLQMNYSSRFKKSKALPWIQQLSQHFNVPIAVKKARLSWFPILLWTVIALSVIGLIFIIKKSFQKTTQSLVDELEEINTSLPSNPSPVQNNHLTASTENSTQEKSELNTFLLETNEEKDQILKVQKENEELTQDIENIKYLWHSAIDTNQSLQKRIEIAKKLPKDFANELIERGEERIHKKTSRFIDSKNDLY